MIYQTPELLLVGAAQNLVLGEQNHKLDLYNRDTPIGLPGYGVIPFESLSW